MSKKNFGLGLLFGAAVGVVTGLLTAPKSGKETRQDLKRKTGELKDQASQRANQVKTKTEQVMNNAKQKAQEARRVAEGAVEGAKTSSKQADNTKDSTKKR